MTHLSADELTAWYQQGLVSDRERVIEHLAGCDQCRKALSLLAAADTADVAAPAVAVAEAVPLGYAARKGAPERSRWAAWLRPAYALAAAAVVVLAVLWVTTPDRTTDDNAVRSTELLALAPSGATGSLDFTWESPFEAARYRITVRDAQGQVIFTGETAASAFGGGAALGEKLTAGTDYQWQVAALDRAGEVIAESRATRFRYAP